MKKLYFRKADLAFKVNGYVSEAIATMPDGSQMQRTANWTYMDGWHYQYRCNCRKMRLMHGRTLPAQVQTHAYEYHHPTKYDSLRT